MINFTLLCHNRVNLTRQAIETLGDKSDMTITILAHKCDPDTRQFFYDNDIGDNVCVCFCEDDIGTGGLRNRVIKISEQMFGRGDYLYLSDNDVAFLRPDWAAALVENYQRALIDGFKVIGAYNHPYHNPIAWHTYGDHSVNEVLALALQSMIMTWDVWDKYGPFKETAINAVCQGEDVDFGNAIRADGGRLGVIAPPLLANTGVTNSLGAPIPGADLVLQQAPLGVIVE